MRLCGPPAAASAPPRWPYSTSSSSLSWRPRLERPSPVVTALSSLLAPADRVGIDHEIDVQSSMEELDWVREQGVVMQSARGPVPSLAERVAGGPIRGSWWGHPSGHAPDTARTVTPSSPSVKDAKRALLPMPASPLTTTTWGWPPAASSAARPTCGEPRPVPRTSIYPLARPLSRLAQICRRAAPPRPARQAAACHLSTFSPFAWTGNQPRTGHVGAILFEFVSRSPAFARGQHAPGFLGSGALAAPDRVGRPADTDGCREWWRRRSGGACRSRTRPGRSPDLRDLLPPRQRRQRGLLRDAGASGALGSAVTTGPPSAAPIPSTAPATNTVTPPSPPKTAPGGAATGGVAPVPHRAGDGPPRETAE